MSGDGQVNSRAGAAAGSDQRKSYQSIAAWLRFILPAAIGLTADLWLKSWAFPDGVPRDPEEMRFAGRHSGSVQPLVDHILGFTTTVNQGAVFGFGQGHVEIFLLFSVVALAVILWVFVTSGARQRVVQLALGMITAGAIGNLYDRVMFHGVRDMLRFYVDWYPYIFNIADVLLCLGVPLLMVRWMFAGDTPKKPASGFPVGENPA